MAGREMLDPWMRLSEAADYVGVHFTTLRRWTDEGKVPCIRTPGGRRRFKRSELDAFMSSLRQGDQTSLALASKLEGRIAFGGGGHAGVRNEPWYDRLDEAQRRAMRAEGQRLMAVLMQYSSRNNGGDAFLEEGKRVATQYGEAFFSAGLSLVETISAFILVRRSISDSIYEAGSLAGPPDADTWRLYDRSNHFLDTMLFTILEAYERARFHTALDQPRTD
jgi:excisionase family DNA binding protein